MILLQAITPQGAISADWAMVIMMSVVGVLIITICSMVASHFIGTLKQIRLDQRETNSYVRELDDRQTETEKDTALLKQSITNLNDKMDPAKTAELLWVKIKAMNG
jgi:hypothetical protein